MHSLKCRANWRIQVYGSVAVEVPSRNVERWSKNDGGSVKEFKGEIGNLSFLLYR